MCMPMLRIFSWDPRPCKKANQLPFFLSRKLNTAQRHYTTGEKELLSIAETLKEYRTMFLGCPELHVYTDHKNWTFNALRTLHVLRWSSWKNMVRFFITSKVPRTVWLTH
jgi:hypothetical protein